MKKLLSITSSISVLGLLFMPAYTLALSPVPTTEITDEFNLTAHVSSLGTKLSWNMIDEMSPNGNLSEEGNTYFIVYSSDLNAPESVENNSSDSPYSDWMSFTVGENASTYLMPTTHLHKATYYAVCLMYQDLSQTCSPPVKAELKKISSAFFSDVDSTLDNFIAIESLAREGVVKGNPDGTFAIGRLVNRAEMMRLVLANQNIKPDPSVYKNCFPDVKEEWFAPDVCYAKEKGWIEGNPDGWFKPADTVTPPAVLKMILKPLFEEEMANQTQEQVKAVADQMSNVDLDDWYAPYVAFAKNRGLLHDSFDDLFRINQGSYRALVAEYLFRARLLKNEGWQAYHPHLRDRALQDSTSQDLLGNDEALCHSAVGLPTPDFVFHYIKSKYDVSYTYRDVIPEYEDRTYPYYDPGYICLLPDGGTLVSNSIMSDQWTAEKHLIHFDVEANVVKDESVKCERDERTYALELKNGLDADSLEILNCHLFKDKNYVHYENAIETIDLASLENIGWNYLKDKNRVYWHSSLDIEEADLSTFKPINSSFAMDKNHAYYDLAVIENVELSTFEVLGNSYSKDAQRAYYSIEPIVVSDLETFEEIDVYPYRYAKDKEAVYYLGEKLPEVDMETFQMMGDMYAKDKDSVYYGEDIIPGADAQSFEIVDSRYAKDKNHVYFDEEILMGLDPSTFQILETGDRSDGIGVFVKDSDQVFYLSEELTWVDAVTFEVLGWGYAKDKNYAISGYKTINDMDVATFEVVEEWLPEVHTKDKNGAYCGRSPQTDGHCVTYPLFGGPQSIPITF